MLGNRVKNNKQRRVVVLVDYDIYVIKAGLACLETNNDPSDLLLLAAIIKIK